jgi:microcystin-dependent protein
MSEPFLAEIRVMGFNFAPTGWATCDGQLMPISQNTALFSLLGAMYGGDGRVTFGLPDLRDAIPMHAGAGPGLSQRFLGERSGEDSVSLIPTEMPVHSHSLNVSSQTAHERRPVNQLPAAGDGTGLYDAGTQPTTTMHFSQVAFAGSGLPHENRMPTLALKFCIALQGIFPQRP